MGLHLLDPKETPATPEEWVDPVLVYCTYAEEIVAFEPMWPFRFNHGDESHTYSREITEMVEPITHPTLPNFYSIEYDAETGVTTVTVKGKSAISQDEFKEIRDRSIEDSAATATIAMTSLLVTVILSWLL